jgi:hypothetical protein
MKRSKPNGPQTYNFWDEKEDLFVFDCVSKRIAIVEIARALRRTVQSVQQHMSQVLRIRYKFGHDRVSGPDAWKTMDGIARRLHMDVLFTTNGRTMFNG